MSVPMARTELPSFIRPMRLSSLPQGQTDAASAVIAPGEVPAGHPHAMGSRNAHRTQYPVQRPASQAAAPTSPLPTVPETSAPAEASPTGSNGGDVFDFPPVPARQSAPSPSAYSGLATPPATEDAPTVTQQATPPASPPASRPATPTPPSPTPVAPSSQVVATRPSSIVAQPPSSQAQAPTAQPPAMPADVEIELRGQGDSRVIFIRLR